MTLYIPQMTTGLRFVPVVYGVALLIWMGLEDNSALAPAILGVLLALLVALAFLLRHFGGQAIPLRLWLPLIVVWGLVTGASAAFSAALLMLFKNGWHAHIYPDFPPLMIRDMLLRLPAWSLAGLFLSLAAVLLRLVQQTQSGVMPSGR